MARSEGYALASLEARPDDAIQIMKDDGFVAGPQGEVPFKIPS